MSGIDSGYFHRASDFKPVDPKWYTAIYIEPDRSVTAIPVCGVLTQETWYQEGVNIPEPCDDALQAPVFEWAILDEATSVPIPVLQRDGLWRVVAEDLPGRNSWPDEADIDEHLRASG